MNRRLSRMFHFLGSVHFAITLIGFTALFVIFGTLIESKTGSHRFAAVYSYKHPAFLALLFFFFINILFAALRRWPFRARHIPFLITHLGLLMIIAGTAVKELYGLQGAMSLLEGSGSHEVLTEETFVVRVEKKGDGGGGPKVGYFDLIDRKSPYEELGIELIGYSPDTQEVWETWIKGSRGSIAGLNAFPAFSWDPSKPSVPVSGKVKLLEEPYPLFNLYALKTEKACELIEKCYLEGARVQIKDLAGGLIFEGPLEDLIKMPLSMDSLQAAFSLQLGFSRSAGFQHPKILAEISDRKGQEPWRMEIPLAGAESLMNQHQSERHFGKPPYQIDLIAPPFLLLIQDSSNDAFLVARDPNGRVFAKSFLLGNFKTLAVYDEGFGGYAATAEIPFSQALGSRESKEKRIDHLILEELAKASEDPALLAPPLRLFYTASKKAGLDFSKSLLAFLEDWEVSDEWVFPEERPLKPSYAQAFDALDWNLVPPSEKNAAIWGARFFQRIAPLLKNGRDPQDILTSSGWPIPLQGISGSETDLLEQLTEQLFLAGPLLPEPKDLAISNASAFSAYLLAYGIKKSALTPPLSALFNPSDGISLEAPIARRLINVPPKKKIEENIPGVALKFKKEGKEEIISLPFDKTASGLAFPVLDGGYLVRFQPALKTIPVHVRLRQARQINYAGEAQAFSYESDLLLTDLSNSHEVAETLSMNRVHETKEGYRLYLAGIYPPNETAVKRIQLIVNYDPAKYLLTYPGGALITAGIVLLFWFAKPKKTHKAEP